MLQRAGLRSIARHRYRSIPLTALRRRTYADRPKRPPPPPPPASSHPAARPPPPQHRPGASGQARQTSPGTSVPTDQTWKPKDGIKFNNPPSPPSTPSRRHPRPSRPPPSPPSPSSAAGARARAPAAAMPAAASAANRAEAAAEMKSQTSIDKVTQDPVGEASRIQGRRGQGGNSEKDEPVPGSLRDQVQDAQARAENTAPPADRPTEEAAQPTGPLPDLRQGIPSTFDMEFGGAKARDEVKQERPSGQTEGVDVTTTPPEQRPRGQRDEGEREYDGSAYETSLDRRRAQMANWLYAAILFSLTSAGFYFARPFNMREEVPSKLAPEDTSGWSPSKMYARMRARLGSQLGYYTEPTFPKLLPNVPESQRASPFTLVLSLEDLLIHSSWDRTNGYRVAKRPGIDYFIRYLSQYYELVLFTSTPLTMADPVIKKLDPYHFIMWPLGREATKYEGGEYLKDLSYLNRPLDKIIIIDTHAAHVKNQPENAIIVPKWSGDPKDPHTKDLVALIPFLEYVATMGTQDVRPVLKSFQGKDIAAEFARRESIAREEFNKQFAVQKKSRSSFGIGSLAAAFGVKGGASAMGGGQVWADGQSVAEGLAQGKMMSDQIREQGQKQYEQIEKQIREHGAQWLEEEEQEQKKMVEAQMRDMKKGAFSWFAGAGKE